MEHTDAALLESIDRYIGSLFPADGAFSLALSQSLLDASAAGLPAIQVSPNQGKLLYLLAKMTRAARILEIGTLGGYSAIWLARALPPDGKLITLEVDPKHAEVARANIDRAGFADRVEILIGDARESLRHLIQAKVPPFDFIFIDADKVSYVRYLELSLELSRAGTVIVADNVIRGGRVLESAPEEATDAGAKAYNEAIARHPRLESIVLPILRHRVDGMAISIVR